MNYPLNIIFKLKSVLFFLCLWFLTTSSSTPLVSDSSTILVKEIELKKIESYRNNSAFIYDRVPPPPETPWESFKRWFWKMIEELFYSKEFSNFWDYFQWIIIAVLISLAFLWIYKSEIRAVFTSKKAANKTHFVAANENIHEMDFDTLIKQAIENENYKKAIRLAYLKTLKQLTNKDLINYKIDKTNLEYIIELNNAPFNSIKLENSIKSDFKEITQLFEYVWYGEFSVSSSLFKGMFAKFNDLSKKLS